MTVYVSRQITAEAVQWDGANLAEVQAFAGDDFINGEPGGHVWVRNSEGPFQIHPGYWLTRQPGEPLVVRSPYAFEEMWEPA